MPEDKDNKEMKQEISKLGKAVDALKDEMKKEKEKGRKDEQEIASLRADVKALKAKPAPAAPAPPAAGIEIPDRLLIKDQMGDTVYMIYVQNGQLHHTPFGNPQAGQVLKQ